MANYRVKLVQVDSNGDKDQVFPETDQDSIIGLSVRLSQIEADIKKIKAKVGIK